MLRSCTPVAFEIKSKNLNAAIEMFAWLLYLHTHRLDKTVSICASSDFDYILRIGFRFLVADFEIAFEWCERKRVEWVRGIPFNSIFAE